MHKLFRGKLPPKIHKRTLKLAKYLGALAPVPASCDWGGMVTDWLMLGNGPDANVTFSNFQGAGDCTCAGAGHAILEWQAQTGRPVTVTAMDVLAAYSAITGYDPAQTDANGNNPTDGGAAMTDVLEYWRTNGICGHKIGAWLKVDHTNLKEVFAAAFLFGGLYTGVTLPDNAMDDFMASQPFNDTSEPPDEVDGHCIWIPSYDAAQMNLVTWAKKIQASLAWTGKYVDEMYVLLDPDWISPVGVSPSGLDWPQLTADFNLL